MPRRLRAAQRNGAALQLAAPPVAEIPDDYDILSSFVMKGKRIQSQNLERTWLMLFPFFLILGERKETTKAI